MICRQGVPPGRFLTTQNAFLLSHADGAPRPSFNRTIAKELPSVKRSGSPVIYKTVYTKTNAF